MIDVSTLPLKEVYYLQFPRGMGMPGHARTDKEEIQVGQKEEETTGQVFFCGFHGVNN